MKDDDKVDLAALVHDHVAKGQELEARLNYLIANHQGYVAVSIGELKDYRKMITLSNEMIALQSELLAKVEDGLDKMLVSLGIDPEEMNS